MFFPLLSSFDHILFSCLLFLAGFNVGSFFQTGTLTQNKMCVSYFSLAGGDPLPVSQCKPNDARVLEFGTALALCNDAKYETATDTLVGNATDIAALHFAEQILDAREFRSKYPEVAKVPFSSDKKWMATVHSYQQGGSQQPIVFLKGAPERVIEHCSAMLSVKSTEWQDIDFDADCKARILSIQESLASTGARVLAICRRRLDVSFAAPNFEFSSDPPNFPLDGMTLLGLIAITDSPRESSLGAVRAFQKAGIRCMMITGDHPATARSIAQQVGIITTHQVQDRPPLPPNSIPLVVADPDNLPALVLHGSDIASFDKTAWDWIFSHKELVFARTTPHHKLTIIQEAQKRDHSVAVTGDGVFLFSFFDDDDSNSFLSLLDSACIHLMPDDPFHFLHFQSVIPSLTIVLHIATGDGVNDRFAKFP